MYIYGESLIGIMGEVYDMAKDKTVVYCDEDRCVNYLNINTCPFGGRIPKKDVPCKHKADISKRVKEMEEKRGEAT